MMTVTRKRLHSVEKTWRALQGRARIPSLRLTHEPGNAHVHAAGTASHAGGVETGEKGRKRHCRQQRTPVRQAAAVNPTLSKRDTRGRSAYCASLLQALYTTRGVPTVPCTSSDGSARSGERRSGICPVLHGRQSSVRLETRGTLSARHCQDSVGQWLGCASIPVGEAQVGHVLS